ncbi:MAG: SRPBCC family protein [Sulfurifustis sp.]
MKVRHAGMGWLAAAVITAHAGEVLDTQVLHDEGRYTVSFDVRLAAPPERLKHYLTDYDNYTSYFTAVKESQVLGRTTDGALRVRLRMRSCILFFCRTVNLVKDVAQLQDGTITARIETALSDFREANERWRITGTKDGQTRLQYHAQLVPAFYVPPLIGPWLLKNEIRDALEAGAEKLETLAAHD